MHKPERERERPTDILDATRRGGVCPRPMSAVFDGKNAQTTRVDTDAVDDHREIESPLLLLAAVGPPRFYKYINTPYTQPENTISYKVISTYYERHGQSVQSI